jgi:hypothetical protein
MKKNTSSSTTNAEAQRRADLEEIRTPRNSHMIDQAIANGITAEHTALNIIKNGLHLSEEEYTDLLANEIAAVIKSESSGHDKQTQQGDVRTGDPEADAILAEYRKMPKRSI